MAPLLYFHGLPGSTREVDLSPARPPGLWVVAASQTEEALAGTAGPVDLAAFSLGAPSALRTAARHPDRVRRVTLIAPAAPLDLVDVLDQMAGAPILRVARRGRLALRALTAAQRAMVWAAPGLVLDAMFRTADPTERSLLDDPAARSILIHGLRESLGPEAAAYRAALLAYVAPWAQLLPMVRMPVRVLVGEADTWAPPAMGRALAEALPAGRLTALPGLGHYGTLIAALSDATLWAPDDADLPAPADDPEDR